MNKVIVFSSALVAVWCHQELPQHRVIRVGMGILLLVGHRRIINALAWCMLRVKPGKTIIFT